MKPAFQEERRFCFEVKTKDTTILLQAETQADLTAWIATFEQAKRTAVNSSSSMASQASSIIPPSAPPPDISAKEHLQHDENISMGFDRSLTLPLSGVPLERGAGNKGKDRLDRTSTTIVPPTPTSAIGALMTATHSSFPLEVKIASFPTAPLPSAPLPEFSNDIGIYQGNGPILSPAYKSNLAPNTFAGAPSPIFLMKSAAVTASSSTPESFQSLVDSPRQFIQSKHKKSISLDLDAAHQKQRQLRASAISEDEIYPPNYPQQLRAQDTHFRVLFPGEPAVDPVLLVFLGAWNFRDRQEISGRFYVTRKNLYFYAHSLGLVFKKVMPLNSMEEVKASPGTISDYIVLHLHPKDPDDSDYEDGAGDNNALKVHIKVFLEPVRLLQRRLDLLLKSEGNEQRLQNTAQVLDKLVGLEHEPEELTAPDSESWEEVSAGYADGHDESRRDAIKARSYGKPPRSAQIKGNTIKPSLTLKLTQVYTEQVAPARLVFPSNPIELVPTGMDKKSLEREFDVPAKALFHVLFGDKSIVYQRLYQGYRAQG